MTVIIKITLVERNLNGSSRRTWLSWKKVLNKKGKKFSYFTLFRCIHISGVVWYHYPTIFNFKFTEIGQVDISSIFQAEFIFFNQVKIIINLWYFVRKYHGKDILVFYSRIWVFERMFVKNFWENLIFCILLRVELLNLAFIPHSSYSILHLILI